MNWFKKIIEKIGLGKAVATTVIVTIIGIGVVIIYQQNVDTPKPNSKTDVLELKKDNEVYEYGDIISLNPEDYVAEETSQDVLNSIDVGFNKIVGSDSVKVVNPTEKQEVGTYKIVFTYDEEVDEVTIDVKDTQAPVIALKQTEVTLKTGTKFNSKDYVESVKDPVDGDLEYRVEGEVNTKKVGMYTITYKAVDKNNNESIAVLKVMVNDKMNNSASNNHVDTNKNDVNDNNININVKDDVDNNVPGSGDEESIDDPKASMGGQPKDETPKKEAKPWTPEEVPAEKKGQAGVAFKTWQEAEDWALAQITDSNSKWYGYSNYFLQQAQKYGQEQHPNDPWVIRFVK